MNWAASAETIVIAACSGLAPSSNHNICKKRRLANAAIWKCRASAKRPLADGKANVGALTEEARLKTSSHRRVAPIAPPENGGRMAEPRHFQAPAPPPQAVIQTQGLR